MIASTTSTLTTASSFEWSYGYDAASGGTSCSIARRACGASSTMDSVRVLRADPASGLFEYSSIFGLYYW